MELIGSIDWAFVESLFGAYGKIVALIVALILALITLTISIYRYLHAGRIERTIEKTANDMQRRSRFLEKAELALKQAEATLKQQRKEIELRELRLNNVRTAFRGKEHDLWCMHSARKPFDFDNRIRLQRRKPIVMVANLKGGVGKTTLTANLAAYFSNAGKRVLLVDVDYQGSLSNMLLSADAVQDVSDGVETLLADSVGVESFEAISRPFTRVLRGSSIVTSKYEFASLENRLMIEYLLQDGQDDSRYRLANVLLDERVAEHFDIVLIDAPPRLTAGAINAFCASTHLLVPTVYDGLSAEAVGTFLNGARILRDALNPGIDLLGVVGMLTAQQGSLAVREENAKRIAIQQVAQTWSPNHYFFDRHIPRRAAIAVSAGERIAYFGDSTVKEWFDELGADMSRRLGWGAEGGGAERQTNRVQAKDLTALLRAS